MTALRDTLARLKAAYAQIKPGRIEHAWVNDDETLAQMNFGDDLREAFPQIAAALDRAQRVEEALRWYADGHHCDLAGWDSCSGESANWLFPPSKSEMDDDPSWMVDDGGVARSVLDLGHMMNPDADGEEITLPVALAQPDEKESGK